MEQQLSTAKRPRRTTIQRITEDLLNLSTLKVRDLSEALVAESPQLACMVADSIAAELGMELARRIPATSNGGPMEQVADRGIS